MTPCNCVETVNQLTRLIFNDIEKEIFIDRFKLLVVDLLKQIYPGLEDYEKVAQDLMGNISLLYTFLNYDGDFLLALLRSISSNPLLYTLANAFISSLMLQLVIQQLIADLQEYKKLYYKLIEEKRKRGRLNVLSKTITESRTRLNRVRNYIIRTNNKLFAIKQTQPTVEDIYKKLCKSDIKPDSIPNLLILVDIEILRNKILGKYTIFVQLMQDIKENLQQINLNIKEKIPNVANAIFASLIRKLIELLTWNNSLIVMCNKLNLYLEIVRGLPIDNKKKLNLNTRDLKLLIRNTNNLIKETDYLKLNITKMEMILKKYAINDINFEINSLRRIGSFAGNIINNSIFNNSILKDFINTYKNIVDTLNEKNNSLVHNLLSGKISDLLKDTQNPFLSLNSIDKILECYNIKPNLPFEKMVSSVYFETQEDILKVITKATHTIIDLKNKILEPLKFKFNINVDKLLTKLKEMNLQLETMKKREDIIKRCI